MCTLPDGFPTSCQRYIQYRCTCKNNSRRLACRVLFLATYLKLSAIFNNFTINPHYETFVS